MIAISILAFAQTSYSDLLKNVVWRVMKINYNNTDYFTPSPFSTGKGKLEIRSENNDFLFNASFFNLTSGRIIFGANNENNFTVMNVASTLSLYSGENETAVKQFDGLTSSFYHNQFSSTDQFYFDYEEVSGSKSLVVTNPNGMKIYYSDKILATENSVKTKVNIYPNPTSDILQLKNIDINSDIKILDAQGKLILRTNNVKQNDITISVKHLTKGVYYLLVGNQNLQFIKK